MIIAIKLSAIGIQPSAFNYFILKLASNIRYFVLHHHSNFVFWLNPDC